MKLKILIFLTLVAVGAVGFYAFNASKKSTSLQSPVSNTSNPSPSSKPSSSLQTKSYTDPSGFKFSYPDDLKVTSVDKNNPDYYSSLKLDSEKADESLTIELTATKYTSLTEWEKNNLQFTNNSEDTELAGLSAKEIKSKGKIMIIAVDVETLITLTASFSEENSVYWQKVMEIIVSTFAFELPDSAENTEVAVPVDSSEEDIVFEGEEVIE